MTRAIINTGTFANDGTGDTLRAAAEKINNNFFDLYSALGDSSNAFVNISFGDRSIIFEGTTANTTLSSIQAGSAVTINLPDSSGTITLNTATQTLTNKTLDSATLITPLIFDSDETFTYTIKGGNLIADKVARLPNFTGKDSSTFIFTDLTQTLTNKTLDSADLNTPNIDQILGTNNNPTLSFGAGSTDYLEVTGGDPSVIAATGSSTDISIELRSKGTGIIKLKDGAAVNDLATVELGKITTSTQQGLVFDLETVDKASNDPIEITPAPMISVVDSSGGTPNTTQIVMAATSVGSIKYVLNNTSKFDTKIYTCANNKFEHASSIYIQ